MHVIRTMFSTILPLSLKSLTSKCPSPLHIHVVKLYHQAMTPSQDREEQAWKFQHLSLHCALLSMLFVPVQGLTTYRYLRLSFWPLHLPLPMHLLTCNPNETPKADIMKRYSARRMHRKRFLLHQPINRDYTSHSNIARVASSIVTPSFSYNPNSDKMQHTNIITAYRIVLDIFHNALKPQRLRRTSIDSCRSHTLSLSYVVTLNHNEKSKLLSLPIGIWVWLAYASSERRDFLVLTLGCAITIGVIGGTRAGRVVLVCRAIVFRQGVLRHWRVGTNWWKLDGASRGIRVVLGTLCCLSGGRSACSFLGGLALRLLLLLARLPLLANLLEL